MQCPHCLEEVSIKSMLKTWLLLKIPDRLYWWLNDRYQQKSLERLQQLVHDVGYYCSMYLTDRELTVVNKRFYGYSFEEIAKDMNVTMERIRQIEAKAMRKLEKALENK